jgi:hypothetical protein
VTKFKLATKYSCNFFLKNLGLDLGGLFFGLGNVGMICMHEVTINLQKCILWQRIGCHSKDLFRNLIAKHPTTTTTNNRLKMDVHA